MEIKKIRYGIHTVEFYARNIKYDKMQQLIDALEDADDEMVQEQKTICKNKQREKNKEKQVQSQQDRYTNMLPKAVIHCFYNRFYVFSLSKIVIAEEIYMYPVCYQQRKYGI